MSVMEEWKSSQVGHLRTRNRPSAIRVDVRGLKGEDVFEAISDAVGGAFEYGDVEVSLLMGDDQRDDVQAILKALASLSTPSEEDTSNH